jgi:hypothetical protein
MELTETLSLTELSLGQSVLDSATLARILNSLPVIIVVLVVIAVIVLMGGLLGTPVDGLALPRT